MGEGGSLGVFIVVVTGYLCRSCSSSQSSHIVAVFEDATADKSSINNHLLVHNGTGMLYVGAVNRIYQLDPQLRRISSKKTGPFEDSPECSGRGDCPDKAPLELTNNVNKALAVDYDRAKLISCGSLYQGSCWVTGLDFLTHGSKWEIINKPVVANDGSASTVAFIAPGPPTPSKSTVLYVGVTYTGNSNSRHEVPAVSSRSLNPGENLFGIIMSAGAGTSSSGTKMDMGELHRINYVYGFSSGGFSYFLTRQKKVIAQNSRYISQLVRVCQDDPNYYSYTEIPIECVDEMTGKKFDLVQAAFVGKAGFDLASKLDVTVEDDVLFTVFARADLLGSQVGRFYSICVYTLKEIRRRFVDNVQPCLQGRGNRGMLGFVATYTPCKRTKYRFIEEDFCGTEANTPFRGERPVVAMSILNFTEPLTAIAATAVGNYTVVFLGTKHGHVKKVVVESTKFAFEYDEVVVDRGEKVNPDMLFDTEKAHLYVMTDRKVSKILVQNCSKFTTCYECVDARDPYCGWCSLQNKCTLLENCPVEPFVSWISYKNGRCPLITEMNPSWLPTSTAQKLVLNIENLHTRAGDFACIFRFLNGMTLKIPANLTTKGAMCFNPTPKFPAMPDGQHHFPSTLSIQMAHDGTPVLDVLGPDVEFFDCNSYRTCTSCVTSPFPCDWCVNQHSCVYDTAANCRRDILVMGLNRVGPRIRSGPKFCPRIQGSSEILVLFGTEKRIQVKVDNIIQQMVMQPRFSCRFDIDGRVTQVNAQLMDSTVSCDPVLFNYNSPAASITVKFSVTWDKEQTKALDNPDGIHIKVYRCSAMADNCGMCLTLNEKFNCGWCHSSSRCDVRDQCDDGMGVWLNRHQICPNPEIRDFHPKSSSWEGGTIVRIDGINLGKTFDDIVNGVSVAGVFCEPDRHLYQQTREIVCKLDSPGINELVAGPIIVRIGDYRAQSNENYRFVHPKVHSVSPNRGPMAGGTRVTIIGEDLNAGSHAQAFIGDIPCEILLREEGRMQCRAGPSLETGTWPVVIKLDRAERSYDPGFTYVDNPIINLEKEKVLRGIPAGGIKITVEGRNFNAIQEPFIYVIYSETRHCGRCNVSSDDTMVCFTPKFDEEPSFSEEDGRDGLGLIFGFILDTVDIGGQIPEENKFRLFPNPTYDKFEDDPRESDSDYLTINGRNLNLGSDESDIAVMIGNSVCNITSLSKNELTCKLPPSQPPHVSEDGRLDYFSPPTVVIQVGQNLMYEIGRLRFDHVPHVEFPQIMS